MTPASWIVVVMIGLVLWTLIGFPLSLAWRARVHARPLSTAASLTGELPMVTAVIPVHNGAAYLEAKVASVLASDYPADRLDVILVSDGSTDDTDAIGSRLALGERIRFMALPKGGKAVALSAAFEKLDCEIVLLTDVRQPLERDCARRLVHALTDPEVGAVSGRLKIFSGETSGEASTGLYWKYETWIRDNLSAVDSVLGATGGIYAIRRSLARPLPPSCILDDVWLPMQIVLDGYRAVLAAEAVAWDYPTSLSTEFGRKVRTQSGLYQLFGLDPRLLSPRSNRLFWSLVNLKLLRLLLPHMLLTILVASLFLPPRARAVMLVLQAAFYGAALLDRVLGEQSGLKRLTAPIAAFVTLTSAAFYAQSIFFRDPATLWKPTLVSGAAAPGQAE